MRTEEKTSKAAGVSSEAVQAKTGKTWLEWFDILDKAGARKMDHKQIVAYLSEQHQVGPWWQQMVTVGYEQERGLREKHEMPEGYQISRSKTIAVPVGKLYKAWKDGRVRRHWLPEPGLTIRRATSDKTIRASWADGTTSLDVAFYPKGENKTQVTVQHNKLADADEAGRMKAYWAAALNGLKEMLEG